MAKQTPAYTQERYKRVLTAWEAIAPTKALGGLTLEQYRTKTQRADGLRDQIDTLNAQLDKLQSDRDDFDSEILRDIEFVVNGVKSDRELGGANGALYEAMGFVPTDARKSGLTRKRKDESVPKAA